MKAQRVKMSAHATEDRLDRLTYIAMNVGFGDVAYKIIDTQHTDRYYVFTTTGVMMVKTIHNDLMITAYVPTVEKTIAIFRNSGTELPTTYKRIIVKNKKHNEMQDKVKY